MTGLTIIGIEQPGIANQERVHLAATEFTDLGRFLLFNTFEPAPGKINPGGSAAYWFPPTVISPRDHIFVFTGPGANTSRADQTGARMHFFYWGMPKTLWHLPTQGVVLIEARDWVTGLRKTGPSP